MIVEKIQIHIADGLPYSSDLIAVIDESTPSYSSGLLYIISTVVMSDPQLVCSRLVNFFPSDSGRSNPFHWQSEGPQAKERMLTLIVETNCLAVSVYRSIARNQQVEARRDLLAESVQQCVKEGVGHLIIENGDHHTNLRDREVILDQFRDQGGVPFAYDWRTKKEPLLWLADAVCGAISASYSHGQSEYLDRLIQAGIMDQPCYLPER